MSGSSLPIAGSHRVASFTEDGMQEMMIQHLVDTVNQRSGASVPYDSDEDSSSTDEKKNLDAALGSSFASLIAVADTAKFKYSIIQDHMDQYDYFDQVPHIVPVPEEQLFLDLDLLENGHEVRSQRVCTKSVFFNPFFMRHYCVTPPFPRTPQAMEVLGNNVWVRALRYPFGRVHCADREVRRIFPELASAYYIYISTMPFMGKGISNLSISTMHLPCSQCGNPTNLMCQCRRQYLCNYCEKDNCRRCNQRSSAQEAMVTYWSAYTAAQ